MLYNKRLIKFTAKVLLVVMTCQLAVPATSFALTSGPTQPEVQAFEPVGTTDMVDMFTGDFVYNIPLLDVEGYPVNICYHSGADMEQEASWVGLGWNINPGEINRTVRGLPDDFDGDVISKTLSMKDEREVRVGLGLGAELAGVGSPILNLSADLSANLTVSNYRGVSADFSLSAGVNVLGMASAGINMGVGSQSGADVDYNLGLSFNSSMIASTQVAGSLGLDMSQGYNTRTGVKDRNFGISTNVSIGGRSIGGPSFSVSVPIGLKNVVPVITNQTVMTVFRGQIKLGGEVFGVYPHAAVYGMISDLHYVPNSAHKGYGYLYAQDADESSIMDFTRDRDGLFNETMHFLPPGNMTYDIYSVMGQGTGGSFRPFRNDFGSVFDPAVSSPGDQFSLNVEAGIGNLLELGGDATISHTTATSGPWEDYKRPFTAVTKGSIYENVYFKQAGEATAVNPAYISALGGTTPVTGAQANALPAIKPGADQMRDPRGSLIYYFTGDEAMKYGVASSTKIYSYNSTDGFAGGPAIPKDSVDRVSGNRKGSQISEMVQVQTDGRRYVYGLPAMNNSQKEATFAVPSSSSTDGLVSYNATDASTSNGNGRDHYYSETNTPAYAHSYLLTSVLSADYVDVTGNGPTDDDFGSYTKFNYTRKNAAYHWKAPFGANKAQYDPGFKSDPQDDKASFLSGDREQWYLHSIETKNFVAEFYTSARLDGEGTGAQDLSYKLDSIKLFNKHDRFINTVNAVPIKTVILNYDYSLCKGIPNTSGTGSNTGKLTLTRIFIRYGNSDKSMISPYRFTYANNYNYSAAGKDRWGAYKPNNAALPNTDFPFVNQNDAQEDNYASAWSLSQVTLPSGGAINIQYESDDYAYVQDKPAMEMFMLSGVGNSPGFTAGTQLYFDKDNPNLYFYFTRRTASEKPNLSFKDNYLKGQTVLYCNFNTCLANNSYEPIKGYAEIEDAGPCSDGIHGYVKVKAVTPQGGGAALNPETYTAINFARYYLPQVIFPGNNPDNSDIQNVLAGLKYAFSELLSFAKNPVKRMAQEGKAKQVKLASSFMRLNSPGMKKKGGGSRVKQLSFYDNWSKLAGGNAVDATYGKVYDYTTEDEGSYGTISSGVASYEPQIGGDENPFRLPVNYSVQSGSKWPPNDPVGVYQEMPVGESLYPSPVVGYSRVTVKSIHQQEGRSSQGEDIYDFYTAKDFPIQALSTPLNALENKKHYSFTEQSRVYKGTQGYTLVFNDMHGKPKRVEHRIIQPSDSTSELVSYQQYIYNTDGSKLSNTVPVMEFDPVAGQMKKIMKQVGYEADMTIDAREKKEVTTSNTMYANLNLFIAFIIPIPIPFWYQHDFDFENQFNSVVATKVVQQYGILKEVQSMDQGALTTMRNEAFDPVTGQALITSINNEFNDRQYSVSYPAYWGYRSMGPAYENTGYTEHFDNVSVSNYQGELPTGATALNYHTGDELLISYTYNGGVYTNNVWVSGFRYPDSLLVFSKCASMSTFPSNMLGTTDTVDLNVSVNSSAFPHPLIKPRFKYQNIWPAGSGTLTNVNIKVIRSGAKNQLNESIEQYTAMETPFDAGGYLKDQLSRLVSINAREFSDTLTAVLPKYDSVLNPLTYDSLNEFVNGTRQIKRLYKEYAYMKTRDYGTGSARSAGLFSAVSLWKKGMPFSANYVDSFCWNNCTDPLIEIPYSGNGFAPMAECFRIYHITGAFPVSLFIENSYMQPQPAADPGWVTARTVTKYSPWGYELENKDAIGNYTAAQYGYNNQLPVSLAENARQQEVFSDNFEDFRLLQVLGNLATMTFSPFGGLFTTTDPIAGTAYGITDSTGALGFVISNIAAHTGNYSLATTTGNMTLKVTLPSASAQPEYLPFALQNNKAYVVSYWFRPKSPGANATTYAIPSGVQAKSNIIDQWQQVEGRIPPQTGSTYTLVLPHNAYVDDIRIYPADANMKAFVYDPVNQKLAATLDENNFATFYEYDQEGNLVRTKKETEKGIITVMESRSATAKN